MSDTENFPIHIILDPSALVRGIGSIRRWIEKYDLVIFIPDYTLRELDFMKKGITLLATNARESIRMIDKLTSLDNDFMSLDDYYDSSTQSKPIKSQILIQTPEEVGPRYEKCLRYKTKTPLVKDFPNYKTEFDTLSVAGLKKAAKSSKEEVKLNSRAEIPLRLRYLIRTCVYKQFVENENSPNKIDWKIITEDSITKIWLQSFQLDVLNLNELEVMIDQSIGGDGRTNFNYYQSGNENNRNNYEFNEFGGNHDKSRSARGKNKLKKEKFETMDYENRGSGELWTP